MGAYLADGAAFSRIDGRIAHVLLLVSFQETVALRPAVCFRVFSGLTTALAFPSDTRVSLVVAGTCRFSFFFLDLKRCREKLLQN
jgi:hypothetical protein